MSSHAFRFPLSKVLEWRESVERDRAEALARAREGEQGARSRLEGLSELRRERTGRVAHARNGRGASVGHLQNLHFLLDQLDARVDEATSRYAEARDELEASMEEFKGAHRDRVTLDNLRERRHGAWRTEQQREDQKLNEEISRMRRGLDAFAEGGSER